MALENLTPEILKILAHYRIYDPVAGAFTVTRLGRQSKKNEPALGEGPLLDPEVIDRFLKADHTPAKEWLDWMLFQAGGGKEAERRSEQSVTYAYENFMDDRKQGYRDASGKHHAPIDTKKAKAKGFNSLNGYLEALWKEAEGAYRKLLSVGDQDLVEKFGIFGYYRHWPGQNREYEKIAGAISKFTGMAKKIQQYNREVSRTGGTLISTNPAMYSNADEVNKVTNQAERYFASKIVRKDIRWDTIYADDFVEVEAPLTYASAVRRGWHEWSWASPENFEQNVMSDTPNQWQDYWRTSTGKDKKVYVHIRFRARVPEWIVFHKEAFERRTLGNLAIAISQDELRNIKPASLVLYDESGETTTWKDVLEKFRQEPARTGEDFEETPYKSYRPVYKTAEEAEEVIAHLGQAMKAIAAWGKTFDPKKIVSNYMPQVK